MSQPPLFPVARGTRVRRFDLFGVGLEDAVNWVDSRASLCVCQNDNLVTESCRDLFEGLSSCLAVYISGLVPTSFCTLPYYKSGVAYGK